MTTIGSPVALSFDALGAPAALRTLYVGSPVEMFGSPAGAPAALRTLYVGSPVDISGQAANVIQYIHAQTTPATVWTVQHNLGRRPTSVTVFSLDYAIQWDEYSVRHLDTNSLYITADLAFPGVALIE